MSLKKLDLMAEKLETRLHKTYQSELRSVFSTHKVTLNKIKAIMDGDFQPPHYCVTQKMKEHWKQKQINKLLSETGLASDMARAINRAGKDGVVMIKNYCVSVFAEAYVDAAVILGGE